MNVWMVSPELSPYVSLGGIASGIRGLAEALSRRGHKVTILVPMVAPLTISASQEHLTLADGGAKGGASRIFVHTLLEPTGIRTMLFDVPGLDPAHGGYGTDVSANPEAARRPGLFARAAVQIIVREHAKERIDIVHAHEWTSAMVPYLLREQRASLKTVMTIHNLAHQGLFPKEALDWFRLGSEHAAIDRLELYGRISLMKGGLVSADQITTVSPTYAKEIQTPEHGELLFGVLSERRRCLTGIVNGIDVAAWSPKTDPALKAPFDAQNLAGKADCKQAFCAAQGLDGTRPLVAWLGRLVPQKGIDLLLSALPRIIESGANIAIAGTGDPETMRTTLDTAGRYPGRAVAMGYIPDEDARRLLAAADLVAMPSRYEPCGIVQLQGMRYGTLPVARRTGGLTDTIRDETEHPESATGFLFDAPTSDALTCAIERAITVLETPKARQMQLRAMQAAFGWEGPVRVYESVYKRSFSI